MDSAIWDSANWESAIWDSANWESAIWDATMLTNRQSRLMSYRQFVCWVRKGQPLGKKYRVTLPACVVKTIREEFLSPDGNYEGFKECACESDISDSD